ncbi:MAG: sel1 repeat family protein, partial [Muribaculaceae bacterium]|nr:sel1 repeat family protein [Muribaculaceae bacterium]
MKKLLLIFSFSLFALASGALTLRNRVSALEKEAGEGNAEAMYHLSTLYEHGFDSIPADSLLSHRLLQRSARAGYAPAQNYLGFKLYPAEKDSAIYWLTKAADAGEMKAVSNLAYILLQSDSTLTAEMRCERDSKAAELLTKATEAGVPTAMASLADLYREGRGVEKDTLQAELLYLDAVSAGLGDAEMKLLSMSHSRYASLTHEQALKEGLRAARSGAHPVAFNL